MSVMSLASGMVDSRAKWAGCDGLPPCGTCSFAWFDAGVAQRGGLAGDTLVIRPASSILVEIVGRTGLMAGDTVRTGRRSGRLIVIESGDGPDGGYDGVCARWG